MPLNYNDLLKNPGLTFTNQPTPAQTPAFTVDNSKALKVPPAAPAPKPVASAIPVDTLGTTPKLNYVAPVATTTARDNLNTSVSQNTAITPPAPVKSARDTLLEEFTNLRKQQGDKGADTLKAQEEAGLAAKREALAKSDEALLRADQAYDDEVKNIEKNNRGQSQDSLNFELGQAKDRYLDRKADIAIDRLANQGDVTAALQIVEDKINAKYEPIQNQIDSAKELIGLYANDLSESEKIQLNQVWQEKQDEKNFQQQKEMVDYQAEVKAKYEPAVTASQTANLPGYTATGKPQTATQASANTYADRMSQAETTLATLGGNFTGGLSFGGSLPNILQSGDRQAYEQAKRNFITAILRRESGAAISPTEFDTAEKQYFPVAGDKPNVVKQKEDSRNLVINSFYREAGVNRPVLPGSIIESDGKRYKVGMDGQTLEEIK